VPDDPRLEALAKMLTEHSAYKLGEVAEWMAGSMRPVLWTDLVDRILVPIKAKHLPTAQVLDALGR